MRKYKLSVCTYINVLIFHICALLHRFIACLCFPILEVLLHTIIDDLRNGEDKVEFMTAKYKGDKKWWKRTSIWVKVARVGLPITYLLIALAILVPGILNLIIEA